MLRLLVAQRLVDTAGLPNADRQGVYEPRELAESAALGKLAARVAPPSVKQHLAEQEAERERREQAYQDEQAARLSEQREQARSRRATSAAPAAAARSRAKPKPSRSTANSSTPATASTSGAARLDDEEEAA